jgi:PAS domain S-box-containing protein
MESPIRLVAEWLIALAYVAISVAVIPLAHRGRDRRSRGLLGLFGTLLLVSGLSQLVFLSGVGSGSGVIELSRLLTGALAVATALLLWAMIPKALRLPSPRELAASNVDLRSQVRERERTETELRRVRGELEERVRERTAVLERTNEALKREIAEREHAEERFRRAVESSPAGMVMIDGKGRIVLVNRAAEEIFDYPCGALIDQPIDILVPDRFKGAHPSHRERFLAAPATRAMGAGRELFGLRSDGTEVPIEIGLNPIFTDEGLFVLSSVVDITERRHAEEQVRAKQLQLERTNRELDDFAHVVSHDLKAPLQAIISLSYWIQEDCAQLLPEESREHLGRLVQRTRQMSDLIDGILRYSRAGRSDVDAQPVDVGELVREVVDALAPPPSVAIRTDGTLPPVLYDRTQLHQVFQNLLANAIQHLRHPAGEVVVFGREEQERWEFSVRDDGPGIDPRHFERIFRIFHCLDPDPDRPDAGIGLAIVKRIVEKNGGSVGVTSQPGQGATFRFSVPKLPPARRDAGS